MPFTKANAKKFGRMGARAASRKTTRKSILVGKNFTDPKAARYFLTRAGYTAKTIRARNGTYNLFATGVQGGGKIGVAEARRLKRGDF